MDGKVADKNEELADVISGQAAYLKETYVLEELQIIKACIEYEGSFLTDKQQPEPIDPFHHLKILYGKLAYDAGIPLSGVRYALGECSIEAVIKEWWHVPGDENE